MPNLRQAMMGAAGAGAGGVAGTLWLWGSGYRGAMGENQDDLATPTQFASLDDWSFPAKGTGTGVFVKSDGTLWGKGDNRSGSLGDGTVVTKSSPVQIGSLTDWFFARCNGDGTKGFTVAVKTDGTLWAWGSGAKGQLGQGTVVSYSSPVQVGSLTDWKGNSTDDLVAGLPLKLGATIYTWGAIKDDGTLWTCGHAGAIGDGTGVSRSSPVQVGSLTDWESIGGGHSHYLATRTNGTLWAWGSGGYGRLGIGNALNVSSPTQVGSLTTWSNASCGQESSHAIKDDGTLWGWGRTELGQVGDNQVVINYSSPIQIGSLTDWSISSDAIGAGFTGYALKTDGSLWGWGYRRVGDGTTIDRSSPVQTSGSYTDWGKLIGSGSDGVWAIRT
jgi:alpha-tubulin suppressor-like RCC1 family protein